MKLQEMWFLCHSIFQNRIFIALKAIGTFQIFIDYQMYWYMIMNKHIDGKAAREYFIMEGRIYIEIAKQTIKFP